MNKHGVETRTAASVDVRFHLKYKTATIQFHTEGKNYLAVTISLHELERLYQKIDQECRSKRGPFAPVTVRPRH